MLPYLEKAGIETEFVSFLDDDDLQHLYLPGTRRKARAVVAGVLRQLKQLARTRHFDAVFIQRGASLVGPPVMEYICQRFYSLPLVFDLDDAIWDLNLKRSRNPVAARLLKHPQKVFWLRDAARLVIAGSRYLAHWAGGPNGRVAVVPTVVSRDRWRPGEGRLSGQRSTSDGPIILGWIGTHTTADQLELVAPALRRLFSEGYDLRLRVVGAGKDFSMDGVPTEAVPWRLDEEVAAFRGLDVGLAPMRTLPVYEGKCGFKQLQYMAVGVPQVCSVVGGARDFVRPGENALVASSPEEWYRALKRLLDDRSLRSRIAGAGRALIEREYCLEVQGPRLAELVVKVAQEGGAP